VILSGDRHLGEISRLDESGLPYPLYDVTGSGLTHHVDFFYHLRSFFSPEPNRHREGKLFCRKNFGVIDIDLSGSASAISMQLRDQENRIQRQANY
jgi:alkaline phosphatase D